LLDISSFKIIPGKDISLSKLDPHDITASPWKDKKEAKDESEKLDKKLDELQELMYAEHKHKLLIILQAMDTGGKDGVIRRVFQGVNPAGVRVAHFREPSQEEIDKGFLWRANKQIPGSGEFAIFNRSYYEGVLVERVHKIVPEETWKKRYKEINEFERTLADEGTTILKFYLHISYEEQRKRIEERLGDPTKQWKFNEQDILERKYWSEYITAYEDALNNTSSDFGPWYAIPANHKWFRDIVVASIIVETLEGMRMHYPKLDRDPKLIDLN